MALYVYLALFTELLRTSRNLNPRRDGRAHPASLQKPDARLARSCFLLTVVMHGWVTYGQAQQPHLYLRVINYQEKDSARNHLEDRKSSDRESVQRIRIIRAVFIPF